MEEMNLEQAMKQLEEMNVIDDFLFTEMMADEKNGLEVCRIIISCVLKREVRNIRRIFLYADGDLPEDADEDAHKIKNLVTYIRSSNKQNVVDENTRKLDSIVADTKSKKDIGIRIMKSWEREREIIENVHKEDQIIIDKERERADKAEEALRAANERIAELEVKNAGR